MRKRDKPRETRSRTRWDRRFRGEQETKEVDRWIPLLTLPFSLVASNPSKRVSAGYQTRKKRCQEKANARGGGKLRRREPGMFPNNNIPFFGTSWGRESGEPKIGKLREKRSPKRGEAIDILIVCRLFLARGAEAKNPPRREKPWRRKSDQRREPTEGKKQL